MVAGTSRRPGRVYMNLNLVVVMLGLLAVVSGYAFRGYLNGLEEDRLAMVVIVTLFWVGYFARTRL